MAMRPSSSTRYRHHGLKTIALIDQNSGFAIDLRFLCAQLGNASFLHEPGKESGDPLGPDDRIQRCQHFPAAIGVQLRVLSQHSQQLR